MEQAVLLKINQYPDEVSAKLVYLRALILNTAAELDLGEVNETLKWGEPSFAVKSGSPMRIDWKPKTPHHYYLFFNCQTRLLDTFRELYRDQLTFQGNRAIVLTLAEALPEAAIKHCITLAFTYQKVKHLPLLGE
ncbi:DUF1801 domain-containing protein [Agarivorans sp. TSD2052]|uniref:DUF1801 domain-containing protein n=1 Tax=Agarivorans sp. TSD2052 TaxID=2937286 RepID=UPI00200FCB70|nr:DUF1801 domain-containing protein [Agarivorans sp. TSD2052]UPW18996.1 DUF1801 domain-containing protein [Agarivorans sp. TSD2052]